MTNQKKYIRIPIPNNRLSALISILIFATVVITIFSQAKYSKGDGYVLADVKGYYSYLPQKFIHDDLQFTNANGKVWFYEAGDGHKRYIKYSTGMAIVYAPGFFIADLWARNSSYKNDGYSGPYQIAFVLTALLFVFLALLYSAKFLSLFFDDKTTALSILIIFIGTNLFHYSTSFLSYSHLYSFTLVLIFLYHSIGWIKKPTFRLSLLIGFVAGLFALIRAIDVIFLLFPIVYGVTSIPDLNLRFRLFWKEKKKLVLALLIGFIVWIPQLIYMFYVWGEFKLNTYQGEHFFFSNPQFYNALFSFRNGWLIYSPLMIISLIGLIYFTVKRKQFGLLLISVIYIFLISSWWCWWYEGFGNRAFINLYPILLLPLGLAIKWVLEKWYKAVLILPVIFFLLFLSMFQTIQFETQSYFSGKMTADSYKETFLRLNATAKFYDLLEESNPVSAQNGINEVTRNIFDTLSIDSSWKDSIFTTSLNNSYGLGFKVPVNSANVIVVKANFSIKDEDYLFLYLEEKYAPCIAGVSESMVYTTKKNNLFQVEYYFTYNEGKTCAGDSLNLLLFKREDNQPIVTDLEFIYIRKTPTQIIID